jgi:hypothetical protein
MKKTHKPDETAKYLIRNGEMSCAVLKDGKIVYQGLGRGISPLIELYENGKGILSDAYVLDRVIGKAAAIILILGGVREVYGERMSKSAADCLKMHNIKTSCGEEVCMILNNAGTGMCPLENSVSNTDDLTEGYQKIKDTLKILRSKS